MANGLGIVDEIKPQASLVLRRDEKDRVIDERGELVGKPISALQFTSVDNILSRSVADVAARDDVRTGKVAPTPAPTGITTPAPVPTATKPPDPTTGLGAFVRAIGPGVAGTAPFLPPRTQEEAPTAAGITPPVTEVAPSPTGIATPTPVEELPPAAPVLGDIDFSSIEGLVKGVGSVAEFTQNLQKFNRSRGISPGGRGRRGIKTSDIQKRIKFLQTQLTEGIVSEEQETGMTDELDILNQFIQSRLGVASVKSARAKEAKQRQLDLEAIRNR